MERFEKAEIAHDPQGVGRKLKPRADLFENVCPLDDAGGKTPFRQGQRRRQAGNAGPGDQYRPIELHR